MFDILEELKITERAKSFVLDPDIVYYFYTIYISNTRHSLSTDVARFFP